MRLTFREKKLILLAMGIFVVTATMAVVVNSFGYGWHFNYSISRYVGLETWSAILFAIGNIGVAVMLGNYLYMVGERWRLKRWFYWIVVLMAMALIGLSACPIGYFDRFVAGKSLPSFVHEICSRTMFACMLAVALVVQFCRNVSSKTHLWCAVFVAYGILCSAAYLWHFEWFYQAMLVFESCYIIGFMILCCCLQAKERLVKE